MTPLSDIHRLLDEAHESSLRVVDLLDLLAEPTDRSFTLARVREPDLRGTGPLIRMDDLTSR